MATLSFFFCERFFVGHRLDGKLFRPFGGGSRRAALLPANSISSKSRTNSGRTRPQIGKAIHIAIVGVRLHFFYGRCPRLSALRRRRQERPVGRMVRDMQWPRRGLWPGQPPQDPADRAALRDAVDDLRYCPCFRRRRGMARPSGGDDVTDDDDGEAGRRRVTITKLMVMVRRTASRASLALSGAGQQRQKLADTPPPRQQRGKRAAATGLRRLPSPFRNPGHRRRGLLCAFQLGSISNTTSGYPPCWAYAQVTTDHIVVRTGDN